MKAFGKGLAAAAIAVGLLVAGGIGILGGNRGSEAAPAVPSDVRADAPVLLAPVAGGSLDATIASLQQHLEASPDDADALAKLGIAYVTQARVTADPSWYPKAQGVLDEATSVDDTNVTALLGEGTLALARHDFAGALRIGRDAERLNPYDADVYGVIGDALVELGRYDQAFDTFQTMVDTKPELASYARVSYARELLGDVPGATDAMQEAFDAAGSPGDRAWAAYQLGELSFNRGDVRSATSWYRRGIELDPEYVPNAAGMAKVAWANGDIDAAISRYADVVARYPSVEYVTALRDLYATNGQDQLAEQQDAVIEATRQLLAANGVDTDLEIAVYDADHGDPERALRAARAEWARRESIHVADALGWALYVNDRPQEARRYAERALALGARNATFLFHAGMIERALGDDARSLQLLREALAVNPHFSILHAPTAERVVAELEAGR
jgi:tetratricopeptide (TPR) repeat protein